MKISLIFKKAKNCIIAVMLLAALFVGGCSKESEPEFSFALIGDVHYKSPDYTIADYFVPSAAEELAQLTPRPEFAVLTGDFFHGGRGVDVDAEAAFAFKHFSETIGMPFYVAIGNHDVREPFEKNALPIYSKELGREITSTWFSFDRENCHFIFLDCTQKDFTEQFAWLEKDLQAASSRRDIDHIFVAGHYPLWIVARAEFTRPEYAEPVARLLAQYHVDAYFCGHTHNHTTTVRKVDGIPLTQIMGAAVVEEGRLSNLAPFLNHVRNAPENTYRPGALALEEAHRIFAESSEFDYYWGNQEGSTSSYFVITVRGKTVQVDYSLLGQGVVRSYTWDRPGELMDVLAPEVVETDELTKDDFFHIEKAWLYAAPWTTQDEVTASLTINGVDAGTLDLSRRAVAWSPFWNKIQVPLGESVIAALHKKNSIQISNPNMQEFGLAHIFILVQFSDGRFAKSSISPFVLMSFEPEEKDNYFSASVIHGVKKGDDLEQVNLTFDRFYRDQN